jgi:outer membrane protein OmpA-like peptidoglycan-associated protein
MKIMYKTPSFFLVGLLLLTMVCVLYAQEDESGSKDHPLLSRMQNFHIRFYEEFEYDAHKFYDEEGNEYVIEGHKWKIPYYLKEGFKPPGVLKIRENYINAIKKIGGTILKEGGHTYMKVAKSGKETWIDLCLTTSSTGDNYSLVIVERTTMEQEVVADPEAMAGDISTTGHVAVYGIYFDLDSYTIKPESEPTLKAISDMLKANSSLKVYVVGHTDMTGTLEHNMELSGKRAEAVVNVLVNKYGIETARLKAKGVGPLCPISTNKTEEGRKLNRRVELVEMSLEK